MLRKTEDLLDLAIGTTDGAIGKVKDLYFDDESWAIRYLVVDAGFWLSSRKVLISPIAAGHALAEPGHQGADAQPARESRHRCPVSHHHHVRHARDGLAPVASAQDATPRRLPCVRLRRCRSYSRRHRSS